MKSTETNPFAFIAAISGTTGKGAAKATRVFDDKSIDQATAVEHIGKGS